MCPARAGRRPELGVHGSSGGPPGGRSRPGKSQASREEHRRTLQHRLGVSVCRSARATGTVEASSAVHEEEVVNDVLEGGCACGELRYRLTSGPLCTHCCHCLNCQRHEQAVAAGQPRAPGGAHGVEALAS